MRTQQRILRTLVGSTSILLLAITCSTAYAQSTPPSAPPPPPVVKDPQKLPPTPGQSPVQYDNKGWVMFDQNVSQRLQLKDTELLRLQELDARYQREYEALGNEPWRSEGYPALSERRAAEVRTLLKPEQYEVWNKEFGTMRAEPRLTAPHPPKP